MIGVFDSGVGGLYVVQALRNLKPNLDILYYGDVAHLPYGAKSPATVTRLTRRALHWFAERRVDHIVIACNTASAIALDTLRGELPMPIHGVIEPAARAVSRAGLRNVGLLGTRGTILSRAFQVSIKEKSPSTQVYPLACPLFVPLVEEGWLYHPLARDIVKATLDELPINDLHGMILGCTHYPALMPILNRLFPTMLFIDTAHTLASELAPILKDGKGKLDMFASDMTPQLRRLAKGILGVHREPEIELLVLED